MAIESEGGRKERRTESDEGGKRRLERQHGEMKRGRQFLQYTRINRDKKERPRRKEAGNREREEMDGLIEEEEDWREEERKKDAEQ